MAREWLFDRVGSQAKEAFPFMGVRCDRVVAMVFDKLQGSDGVRGVSF
jgi:RNA polymerase sigma-70 factor (ECF subfamily)